MASTTATTDPPAAGPGAGQLWQVPVFFLGLLALAGAVLAQPWLRAGHARRPGGDLQALRRQIDQPGADLEALASQLQQALESPDGGPARAAEVHFLLGSVYLKLADAAPPGVAEDRRRHARAHLEQADRLGVADDDRPKLDYRLGKVWALSGGDPRAVIERLGRSVDGAADDAVQGYALLTQAYLRLPRPDLKAALAANEKLLALPITDESLLTPARLLRGELLLKVGRPDEARRVLAKVGPKPAGMRSQARLLRARSFQDEGQWDKAAELWREALADRNEPPARPAGILYLLGVCCQKLEQPEEAARLWSDCAARPDAGDEGAAAALALAELRLHSKESAAALEAFERALRGVQSPADWRNPLVSLARARAVFEHGCLAYRMIGSYENSTRLARLYEKLSPPGKAQELLGQAAQEWGKAKRDEARKSAGDEARRAEDASRQHFRDAATAFEQAAAASAAPRDQAERQWLAAGCWRDAGETRRAVEVLNRVVTLPAARPRYAEAWYALAEAHRALGDEGAALEAYQRCIEHGEGSPFAYRARYHLAAAAWQAGQLDHAADILQDNVRSLRYAPDPEAQEKSLYALGHLLMLRRNYEPAVAYLEEAVTKYPKSPEAPRGLFQLAECHRLLAARESQNSFASVSQDKRTQEHYLEQYRLRLTRAVERYNELTELLGKRPMLSAEEEQMLRQAGFAAAECQFFLPVEDQKALEKYKQARQMYAALADRYPPPKRVEGLYALRGVASCSWAMQDNAAALKAVEQIRDALKQMDDVQFLNQPEGRDRQWWLNWVEQVTHPPQVPPAPPSGSGPPRSGTPSPCRATFP